MYAQRFGSLPIGHQTGGLAETIKDGETGFLFPQPSAESFLGGVRRAFETFRAKDRLEFHATQRDGAVVQLGSFRSLLQRTVSKDRAAAGERLTHWCLVLTRFFAGRSIARCPDYAAWRGLAAERGHSSHSGTIWKRYCSRSGSA